jgi:hypothetical protein
VVANCDHIAEEDEDVVAVCDLFDPASFHVSSSKGAICDLKDSNSSAVS